MKIFKFFIKLLLVIILVFVGCWYLFGEEGPFEGELDLATVEDNGEITKTDEELAPVREDIQEEVEINPVTRLVFTGDVELSEYVQAKYNANGIEGILSDTLIETLGGANQTMINNEFCFSTRGEPADKTYTFRVDPSYTAILKDMGVDVAGLANNHALDYGRDALSDTFDTLSDVGILFTGAGNNLDEAAKLVTYTDDLGRTYGFLASSHVIPEYSWDVRSATPGLFTFYDETELVKRVEEYSKQVDYLFVMVHWGIERTIELEDYQVTDGHKLIDAGAAAVIGMHSHCLQPVEYYNGHPIFYSLGNFIFNSSIKDGAAVEITVDENNELSARIIPIVAADTKTVENYELIQYLNSISDTVDIDEKGNIVSK